MRCAECGTTNPASSRFCEGCGCERAAACPDCSRPVSPGARFCGGCGVALGAAEAGSADPALRIRGEIKPVTVLFADIVGSTQLVAQLDPEEAMARLRPALTTMCEQVERFEGLVVHTLGDGIMALFGAPQAQEGHALLACEAALALQGAFQGGDGVRIRVGLHSGAAVVDAPVAEVAGERAVHGVATHVASRLQALAEPGTTILSGACHQLVRAYCDARPLGRRVLRGVPGEVEVYQLLGLRPALASQQFRGATLAAFRGREHELGVLQRGLQAAESGQGGVIGVAGSPGMGKSRLCYEFAEWCRGRLVPVFEARAHPYGHAAPLQPVLEFLRSSFFEIPAMEPAAATRRRVAARLRGLGPGIAADLPVLYDFLGVADDTGAPRLTPKARHERLLDVVRRLVRYRGRQASVMIVENLHWLDEASEAFVAAVVDAVAGTRTLLVLNYRPAYAAPWMRRPWFREVAVSELPGAAMEALVGELTGDDPALGDLRQRVAERSGGNPFFAEELVRSLAEERALAGRDGGHAAGRGVRGALPATVQAAIGARLDHLGEFERTILQIGAIIGKEFPLAVLGHVAGVSAERIGAGLDRLCDAELLQALPSADGRRCAFRHPLIQEVAYATQLKARRDALHASVATAMERYHADRLDEFAAVLAHHHEAAGQLGEAARHLARAARWIGSTSPRQAIERWREVRELLQAQLASREQDALRTMASAQIAWLGWREGMTAEAARPFIEEAVGLARETNDSLIPLLLYVDARIAGASGGPADSCVTRIQQALSMLTPGRDEGRAATLYAALCQAYGWGGLLRDALAANDAALERVGALDPFDEEFLGFSVEQWARSLRGRILGRLGRFEEAEQCFAAMLGPDFARADPAVRFIPHLGGVDAAWYRGDGPAAAEHAAQIAELARVHGSPYLWAFAHQASGTAKGLHGDHAGAFTTFEEALRIVRTTGAASTAEADMLAGMADAALGMGDHDGAARLAREAIAVAERRDSRLPECRALLTLVSALARTGGPARHGDATALLRRAEALIERTGARIYDTLLTRTRAALTR
jgi:adenylate cyclase